MAILALEQETVEAEESVSVERLGLQEQQDPEDQLAETSRLVGRTAAWISGAATNYVTIQKKDLNAAAGQVISSLPTADRVLILMNVTKTRVELANCV